MQLAEALGVSVVNAFSGLSRRLRRRGAAELGDLLVAARLPGDAGVAVGAEGRARTGPPRPRFAAEHGVTIGIEMHPGCVVYNPATLVRLRDACGPAIAANFDPSHLFWQGIDPVVAIRHLAEHAAIAHVDAKDTALDDAVIARDGVLETRPASVTGDRAFRFRTIGDGHGEACGAASSPRCGRPATTAPSPSSTRTGRCPAGRRLERAVRFLRALV